MSAVSLAMLHDLARLGPDVNAILQVLVTREQGQALPLFASGGTSVAHDEWPHLLRGQPLSTKLARVLVMVQELTDYRGHGKLRVLLEDARIDWPTQFCRHSLAVWAATYHWELFARAHKDAATPRKVRMRTLRGRSLGQPVADSPSARRRLEKRLGKAFDKIGRTSLCRVVASKTEDGLHFLVEHGSSLRHLRTVETGAGSPNDRFVGLRPCRRDHVHYNCRTGVLTVGAWTAPILRAYGAAFGELLFDDEQWFQLGDLVSLAPLKRDGRLALRPTADVIEARLISLTIRAPGVGASDITIDNDVDVLADLDRSFGMDLVKFGTLVKAKIAVRVAGVSRSRTVELKPPMMVGYNWQKGGGAVRRFLERRGFLLCEVD